MSESLQITITGHGINVVFLHGWGVNSDVWQPLISELNKHIRITTVDLPGYGLNRTCFPTPYTLESVADLVVKSIPKNSVLVGWSLGGLIAQQMVYAYPGYFKQLVLVCSSPKFTKCDGWPGIEPKVLRFFNQQLTQDAAKTLERFMAIQSMGSASAKRDTKMIKHVLKRHPIPADEALQAGLNILECADLREQIKHVMLPQHWFLGSADTLVPVKLEVSLKELNPMQKVEVIDDTSHSPFITSPEQFATRLLASLV